MPSRILPAIAIAAALAGCTLRGPTLPVPQGPTPAPGTAQPSPATPGAPGAPGAPQRPAPRQYHLSAATSALVNQAHAQSGSGDNGQAAATLERALRIEPENPLLWTELGQVRLAESNPAQADALGRKALALGVGDPAAQSNAWRLIAAALRARGRNGEAADAEQHASALMPH